MALAGGVGLALFGAGTARGDFRPAPTLGNLTYQAAVATMADGRVLIAGGRNLDNPIGFTNAAAAYDPWNNTMSALPPMSNARYGAAAALPPDGKMLVCGGDGRTVDHYECERYDPILNLWLATAGTDNQYVSANLAPLPGGKELIFPSLGSQSSVYDPTTNSWGLVAIMIAIRDKGPAWASLPDGRVFVAGGSQCENRDEIYDPENNKWTATTATTARQHPTATLLPTGKVLITGGQSCTNAYLSSAQLYDPGTGLFTNAASMSIPRASHAASLLPNGKMLVTGGVTTSGSPVNTAEVYDPATDSWSSTPAMTVARAGHSSIALGDGGALLVGGFDSANNLPDPELYQLDPVSWVAGGSLATARANHTGTLLPNGKVLVAGGYDGVNMLSSAEVFDPSSNSWSTGGSMLHPHMNGTATLLQSGKVLVATGNDLGGNVKDADLYDPATNSWSGGGTMIQLRAGATATLLNDGRVLVTGGTDGANVLQTTELYTPATNSWASGPPMNSPRIVATATKLGDGRVLVAGGSDGTLDLANAEIFDPTANTWTPVSHMNTALEDAQSVLLKDGRVLVAGGELYATLPNIGQIYDPVADTWTVSGPYDIGRRFDGLVIDASGQAILVGGSPVGGGGLSSVELYDVATNQWWDDGELFHPLSGPAVTMLQTGRIVAAGGAQSGPVVAFTDESPAPMAVTISNSGFTPTRAALASMAAGVHWSDTEGSHSVVESVKLGPPDGLGNPTPLFQSGTLTAGQVFGYTFVAGGTYKYKSNVGTAFKGKVTVPDYVFLASDGGPAHIYVAFATGRMPGYVFNVSYRFKPPTGSFGAWTEWDPPGATQWVDAHGVFQQAQSGTYQFRSRLRNATTGKSCSYSPPITVSVP